MKSFYGLALAFLMLISVCAADKYHGGSGVAAFAWGHEDDDARVRVAGSGQITVEADIGTIYAFISEQGRTAEQALDKIAKVLNKIEKVLKENKISNDALVTSFISVFPRYDYANGEGKCIGYNAFLSVTLTMNNINKKDCLIGEVIEDLIEAGVSSVTGVTYDTSKAAATETAARKLAFANAKKKASEYAYLSAAKVGDIRSIDETNVFYNAYESLANNSQLQSDKYDHKWKKNPDLELPAGQVTISVDVIIVWELDCAN